MKAMILAAGIGSRLRPLTDSRPKALIKLFNKPLLQIQLEKLQKAGFRDVVINVHHLSGLILDFLRDNNNFGMNVHISDETNKLLNTGGAVKKASVFFSKEDFLLLNVDVISDLDFRKLYSFHLQQGNEVTLAVTDRSTTRYFLFDRQEYLCGWKNMKTGAIRFVPGKKTNHYKSLAFSGIHIINSAIFKHMPEAEEFSIVDFYLSTAHHYKIKAYRHSAENWWDIGKAADFESLSRNNQINKTINQN